MTANDLHGPVHRRLIAELVLTLGWSYDLRDDPASDWSDAIQEVQRLVAVDHMAAGFAAAYDTRRDA